MWNSKRIGNVGEVKTLSKFVELQIPVCISFGDCERYDMVAEFNGKLNKIQCKTCLNMEDDNSFVVNIINRSTKEGKSINRSYSKEDVDYFSIYNIERIFCYYILTKKNRPLLLLFALSHLRIIK